MANEKDTTIPKATSQPATGDEIVYTDHAGAKHAAIVQHLFSKSGKIVAHLKLKHNGNHLTDIAHDADGRPHTWKAKQEH